jgi:hypothetical protein
MSVLGQLYRLQVIDAESDEKSERLAEVNADLGETDAVTQARAQVADVESRLAQMHKRMRELELQIGGLDAKLKANQERLYSGLVRNPKELASLQEEAKSLKRHCSELEDQELQLMMAVEETDTELARARAHREQAEADWRADQAGLRSERDRLQQRLVELEDMRSGMRSQISARDLALYDDLRDKLGNNCIALIRSGICQVCGVDVPVTMTRAVERSQGYNYCPICNRLLYAGG